MTDREARRQERMEYELRALPRRPTPDGHKWMVDSIIGEGGFGRAYLWNLVRRRDQVVVDRVVIKYCEPDTHDIIARHGPGFGEIAEVFMQRSMMHDSEDPLDDFTVPLLAAEHCSWALDAWRFYTPYYSFGDLYKFILKQGVENPATPTKGHRQVPEPFVWYLLHRLACAARIMDQTLANEDMDYQIVHCDFKPANLFLGAPGSLGSRAQFPIYPPVYVGDFGNAKITYTGDSRRHEMVGTCTPGWSAPEITPFTNNHMPKSWQAPASSKTVSTTTDSVCLCCRSTVTNSPLLCTMSRHREIVGRFLIGRVVIQHISLLKQFMSEVMLTSFTEHLANRLCSLEHHARQGRSS